MKTRAQHFISEEMQLAIDLPNSLPPLPAAVEVACYMIFQEALTNVIRHSEASYCSVSLNLKTDLELCIEDNGRGIDQQYHSGVGMNSMRQRAEELGGKFQVRSIPHKGTMLTAYLPLFSKMDQA